MSASVRKQFEQACARELGRDESYYFNSREGRWYDSPLLNTLYTFWLIAKKVTR